MIDVPLVILGNNIATYDIYDTTDLEELPKVIKELKEKGKEFAYFMVRAGDFKLSPEEACRLIMLVGEIADELFLDITFTVKPKERREAYALAWEKVFEVARQNAQKVVAGKGGDHEG